MGERLSKEFYYLGIADSVSERSTCLRRKYGAIIVRNDEIISTGYNGAQGQKNCVDLGSCERELRKIPGERYELCRSVHAEANASNFGTEARYDRRNPLPCARDAKNGELLNRACLLHV